MASAAPRAWPDERKQEAPGTVPDPKVGPWSKWPCHSLVKFALSLVVLLGFPHVYKKLLLSSSKPATESQLQEVASLMGQIYSTFVNMTFLPPTAIKRGPHQINSTAIPCERTPAALRLMELLPYVDQDEVMEKDEVYRTDWLFGGEFVDYREAHHLKVGCDPIHSNDTWYTMYPNTVALTRWGNGGWNSHRTWVLLYNTDYNAISVYEGENFVALVDKDNPAEKDDKDYTGIDIFTHSVASPLAILPKANPYWETWFDAPTLLRRILHAYQSLAWTPWETSNHDNGSGVNPTIVADLLRKNGWPSDLEPDQFNADFIRAQHAPSRYGPAEAAYKVVEDLEGNSEGNTGAIARQKKQIAKLERKLHNLNRTNEDDEQEYWFLIFRIQSKSWTLDQHLDDLTAAKSTIDSLCRNDICLADSDLILWEFHSIENAYEAHKRAVPIERQCDYDLRSLATWDPPASSLLQNCISKRTREFHWLELAYNQSQSTALLSHPPSSLLPQLSLEELVAAKITVLEQDIIRNQARGAKLYEWLPKLPEHATKARMYHEMEASAAVNAPWYVRERIEWLQEMLHGDEDDRAKLWRCMDDPECV